MRAAIETLKLENSDRHSVNWDTVKAMLWAWIDANGEHEVSLHIWIVRKKFKIKDLHVVFELLLGSRPAGDNRFA